MSKSLRKRRRAGTAPQSMGLAARAKRMEYKLRQNDALGQEAMTAGESQKKVSTREFAESRGFSEHAVRKLKTFARAYNRRELDQLCALRRPNGLPLHWGYVGYLLAADSAEREAGKHGKKEREGLAQLGSKKNWTAPEFYGVIRQKFCRMSGHGCSMVLPANLETAVRKVQDEGRVWFRRWNPFAYVSPTIGTCWYRRLSSVLIRL
jgi:hypothetical protein